MSFGWDAVTGSHADKIITKSFAAELSAIDDVFAFLTEQAASAADDKQLDSLLMIAEEIFVNIASYAYDDGGTAGISCFTEDNPACIHILFTDRGKPFDPTERTEEEAAASVESLTPGGLGIMMVKKMSDGMEYRRLNGENQLYIRKRL